MPGLSGLPEFEKALKDLENKARGEALKKALLHAVQPLIRQAAADAPRRMGELSRSMTAQAMEYSTTTTAIIRVGPGRPEGSHGILLEYGTVFMSAQPFLASAFEATIDAILTDFQEEFENEIING